MNNLNIDDYKIYIQKNEEFETWGHDLCSVYEVKIIKGGRSVTRKFFLPWTQLVDVPLATKDTSRKILEALNEAVKHDIFTNPDYEEFYYANGKFKNVIVV